MDANTIDALGVLNFAAEILAQHGWIVSAEAVDDVRDAVIELMEAAQGYITADDEASAQRLGAALAACGGAK